MTDLKTPCECQSMTSMMLEAELLKAMAENVDLQSEVERLKKESLVGLLEKVVAALRKETTND